MKLTRKILTDGKSNNGAWSKRQLEILGVPWPLVSGWAEKIIGKDVHLADIKRFIDIKDNHIPVKKQGQTKVKIDRAKRVLSEVRRLPILSLDAAAKRLNDAGVYKQASKGFRYDKD